MAIGKAISRSKHFYRWNKFILNSAVKQKINTFVEELEEKYTIIGKKLKKKRIFSKKGKFLHLNPTNA